FGQSNQIIFSRYVPGDGWSAPAALPSPATGVHSVPLVAMSDGGIALATYRWSTNGNAPFTLYAIAYSPASGWGDLQVIPTTGSTLSTSNAGTLALDASGRALRTWPGESNTGWYSWFNGTEWSAATDLDGGQFYGSGNEGTVLNASGRGGTMWRNNYNLISRRFDAATGVLGSVVDLGNNQSGRREIQVDDAGNLFLLRVDGNNLSHIHRLPYDTVSESAYSFQIEGAVNAANCPPDLAVTPTGKTAFIFCKSGPQPYVQHWDGNPTHAANTALLLQGTSNARRTRITATNEDFVLIFSRSIVDVSYMRRSTGEVWDEANTTITAITAVIDQDQLIGSEHGEAIYVRYDGVVGRLR
ncbi:MAG TPA: hypothetical protein VLC93_13470, partial [Myxococcota bacterium]|nr:hypothetical protein [Myxococcota bacterium]